jgi:hypothetical protein
MTRLARSAVRAALIFCLISPLLLLATVFPAPARVGLGLGLVAYALWQLWALR